MSIKNRADLKKIKKFLKNFETIDQAAAYSLMEYRYLAEARLSRYDSIGMAHRYVFIYSPR